MSISAKSGGFIRNKSGSKPIQAIIPPKKKENTFIE